MKLKNVIKLKETDNQQTEVKRWKRQEKGAIGCGQLLFKSCID